jgi:hypothetical protein
VDKVHCIGSKIKLLIHIATYKINGVSKDAYNINVLLFFSYTKQAYNLTNC